MDRDGVSFYQDDRILHDSSLFLSQVLSLSPEPVDLPSREEGERKGQGIAHYYLWKMREGLRGV